MKSADLAFFAAARQFKPANGGVPVLASLTEAYAVQAAVCVRDVSPIAWKLGGVNEATRSALGVSGVYAGPILADKIFPATSTMRPNCFGGQCQAELEIVIRLSEAINAVTAPPEKLISQIGPALECPASVLPFPDAGVLALIADGCAAGTLVHAPLRDIGDWQPLAPQGQVVMTAQGDILAQGRYANLIDGLLGTVSAFLDLAKQYHLPVRPGDLVSTGGLTPCVKLPSNDKLHVAFDGFPDFEIEISDDLPC